MNIRWILLITVIILSYLPLFLHWWVRQKPNKVHAKSLFILGTAYSIGIIMLKIIVMLTNALWINALKEFYLFSFLVIFVPLILYYLFKSIHVLIDRLFSYRTFLLIPLAYTSSVLLLIIFVMGFFQRHSLQVRRVNIPVENLPVAFENYRIVQISDVHFGSLLNPKQLFSSMHDSIVQLKPDLFVLTGDLMNQTANEICEECIPYFTSIEVENGCKYGVLGNHDYGDYGTWKSIEAKQENLLAIKNQYERLGFTLLNDSIVYLEKDSARIALIGVENCGTPPLFSCYGNLESTYLQLDTTVDVQILLSHDPTHWKRLVVPNYPKIDLMLAGHTHGAQFGVEIGDFKWSPSKYLFQEWDGLYEEKSSNQYLWVNRGLGYIGVPFRFGMKAEITVLTLQKK